MGRTPLREGSARSAAGSPFSPTKTSTAGCLVPRRRTLSTPAWTTPWRERLGTSWLLPQNLILDSTSGLLPTSTPSTKSSPPTETLVSPSKAEENKNQHRRIEGFLTSINRH